MLNYITDSIEISSDDDSDKDDSDDSDKEDCDKEKDFGE